MASFPTSYIPTTTAAVTRNADVASITGSNFSRWYSQSQGTVFVDGSSVRNGGRIMMFDNGPATTERWELRNLSSALVYTSWSNNATDVFLFSGQALGEPMVRFRSAAATATNDAALSTNGNTAATDTSCTSPANQSRLFVGSYQGTATFANGTIRRLAYFDRRLPNATLQAITT